MDLDTVSAFCYGTRRALHRTKRLVVLSAGGATRVANFQNVKQSAAELCQILRTVTIEKIINSIHVNERMHVTTSCRHCIAFEVMLLISSLVSCNIATTMYNIEQDELEPGQIRLKEYL